MKRFDDLLAIATEKLYAFPFRDVPDCWREMFMVLSVLKFCCLALKDVWEGIVEGEESGGCAGIGEEDRNGQEKLKEVGEGKEDVIAEMVKTLDLAVIMVGWPVDEGMGEFVEAALKALQGLVDEVDSAEGGDGVDGDGGEYLFLLVY